jgi:hypothetical protein
MHVLVCQSIPGHTTAAHCSDVREASVERGTLLPRADEGANVQRVVITIQLAYFVNMKCFHRTRQKGACGSGSFTVLTSPSLIPVAQLILVVHAALKGNSKGRGWGFQRQCCVQAKLADGFWGSDFATKCHNQRTVEFRKQRLCQLQGPQSCQRRRLSPINCRAIQG